MAYVRDIGEALPKLWKLAPQEVPVAAKWKSGLKAGGPELTSFGASAVEVVDPNNTCEEVPLRPPVDDRKEWTW